MDIRNKIIQGNSLDILKSFDDNSIDCIVTSPPYYNLRDYQCEYQIGLENTPDEYINKLILVFNECNRILKNTGTCFVNLGDTYSENKSLFLIPMKFCIAMEQQGWIVRNVIIWRKPNPVPTSVRDRFSVDFEYIFFFVKDREYYFDQILEESAYKEGMCRIKRCVWDIPVEQSEHIAPFPEELVYNMIQSGCPEYVCSMCKRPYFKFYEYEFCGEEKPKEVLDEIRKKHFDKGKLSAKMAPCREVYASKRVFIDYIKCNCDAEKQKGIVLDPFCGSGTTLLVAKKLNRDFVGIDISSDSIRYAEERLYKEIGLFKNV